MRDEQCRSVHHTRVRQRCGLVEYLGAIELYGELVRKQRIRHESIQCVDLCGPNRIRSTGVDSNDVPHRRNLYTKPDHRSARSFTDGNDAATRTERIRECRAHAITSDEAGNCAGGVPTLAAVAGGSIERKRATCWSNM